MENAERISPRRRKRSVHLYLREDILETLQQISSDSGVSVSRLVEILLGFYWEFNEAAENCRFLSDINRRFRKPHT